MKTALEVAGVRITVEVDGSRDAFVRGLRAVEELMGSTLGVAGLDDEDAERVVTWEELSTDPAYAEWLCDFRRALDLLNVECALDA